jgi:hypothetical protein
MVTEWPDSNQDLDPAIRNNYPIAFHRFRYRQAFSAPHVKLPSVQAALDYVPAELTFTQWRPFVRAKVAGGIKFAVHIVDCHFDTIRKLDRRAVARKERLCAANSNDLAFSLRWWQGLRFSIE